MREVYLIFINNYAGLVLNGWLYRYKLQCVASVLAASLIALQFQLFYILDVLLIVIGIYFIFLAVSMLIWRYESKKLGLKSLVLYPGSVFWFKWMLAKRCINVPVLDRVIEIHVNTKQKYHDWDEYNRAFDNDISKIVNYLKSGRFGKNVTVTFNSFNRRVVDKLETAFDGRATRIKQVALPNLIVYLYLPGRFRKIQLQMFGEVKSTRAVHRPEAWDLLICNIHSGGMRI
ncbi:hypothetical protein [Desulfotruncus alcoholivorax]|uniref:hypothetical protein n=1 Tax=Desulfotruncus alcoholivorax TaxID=265477 RepID=UPI00042A7782|nr:hypothetical protein [Desulfotruncus alcoholivorax]